MASSVVVCVATLAFRSVTRSLTPNSKHHAPKPSTPTPNSKQPNRDSMGIEQPWTLAWKTRPLSGLDCLICAILARQRTGAAAGGQPTAWSQQAAAEGIRQAYDSQDQTEMGRTLVSSRAVSGLSGHRGLRGNARISLVKTEDCVIL